MRVTTGDGSVIPVTKTGGLSLIDLSFDMGGGRSPQDTFVEECLYACQEAYGEPTTSDGSESLGASALGASASRDASFTASGGDPCTALGACAASLAGKAYWGSSASALGVALGAAWTAPK